MLDVSKIVTKELFTASVTTNMKTRTKDNAVGKQATVTIKLSGVQMIYPKYEYMCHEYLTFEENEEGSEVTQLRKMHINLHILFTSTQSLLKLYSENCFG